MVNWGKRMVRCWEALESQQQHRIVQSERDRARSVDSINRVAYNSPYASSFMSRSQVQMQRQIHVNASSQEAGAHQQLIQMSEGGNQLQQVYTPPMTPGMHHTSFLHLLEDTPPGGSICNSQNMTKNLQGDTNSCWCEIMSDSSRTNCKFTPSEMMPIEVSIAKPTIGANALDAGSNQRWYYILK